MANVQQMQPQISVRILKCALVYFEQTFGRDALEAALKEIGGLSLDYLSTESNWVSFEYLEDLLEHMTEVTGDEQFAYHAGLYQSDEQVMPVAHSFVRAIGSPGLMFNIVFGKVGRIALVNKVGQFRVEDSSDNSVVISYKPTAPEYRERNDNLHEFRRGQIASLTKLFNLPPARCVEHRIIGDREESRYEFTWDDRSERPRKPLAWWGLGLGLFVGLIPIIVAIVSGDDWASGMGYLAMWGLVGFLVGKLGEDASELQAQDKRMAEIRVQNQEMQDAVLGQNALTEEKNDELNLANQELAQANEELAEKNRELEDNKAELERLNATLEERVAERTLRLEEANSGLTRVAQELSEANERLKEATRLKDKFFATINHELRTPLVLILTPLESVLANREGLSAEQVASLNTVLANGRRLLKLINDLLDLSKIGADRVRLRYESLDVNASILELIDRFMPTAKQEGLAIVPELEHGLEPVWVDRDRFDQVLNNLVSNAFKFTPSGGQITVRTRATPEQIVLEVEDTGSGVPEALKSKIFDRFSVGSSSDAVRGYGGTGLGLSLVKEIVDLHEGQIELWSEEGVGTRFTVALPLGRNHIRPELTDRRRRGNASSDEISGRRAEDRMPEEARSKIASDLTSLHVSDVIGYRGKKAVNPPPHQAGRDLLLLVDDRSEVLEILVNLLGGKYNLLTAGDGEAALQIALDKLPDLILSDLVMPRKNGYQLCRDIKQDPRTCHIPVILLSAKAGDEAINQGELRGEGIEVGANDFVSKPFVTRELLARISSQLKFKKMDEMLRQHNIELEDLNARLREMATTDHLTGLLNRGEVERRLRAQFKEARETGTEMAVVMFDIDHFRRINNTYGHPDGDKVLTAVAHDTLACSGVHGFAGRYGGEEFILGFPGWDLAKATRWAEQLRQRIAEQSYLSHEPDLQVTISIGVAGYPQLQVENHEALVKLADEALYRAKNGGRDQVVAAA